MKYILTLLMGLALACGGGPSGSFGRALPSYNGIQEVIPAGFQTAYTGETDITGFEQRTVIKSAEDFSFYVRLFTGNSPLVPEAVLSTNYVLMVIHKRSVDNYYFTIDSMTMEEDQITLTVYYYYSPSNLNLNVDKSSYHFYYIPKVYGTTFIEVSK